jgi:hypothetical protein
LAGKSEPIAETVVADPIVSADQNLCGIPHVPAKEPEEEVERNLSAIVEKARVSAPALDDEQMVRIWCDL